MSEFFNVLPPEAALQQLLAEITPLLSIQQLATTAALGRLLAEPVYASAALPAFRRSTMDGFAVRAADTFGASDSLPVPLNLIGEIPMGAAATVEPEKGEAVLVHTGGMIPQQADAVVQVEHTQPLGEQEIEVLRPVAPGQNLLQVGEDVAVGAEILPAGHRLRPQDLGALLALGIVTIAVRAKPRIGILATGDEVIDPASETGPGQIRDINSYTIGALCEQAGGAPILGGIIGDNFAQLKAAAEAMLAEADMLVLTAGSSVSVRDMSGRVLHSLGKPGVLLHGVAVKPGKPTIVGAVGGKPILGLPGNPVSAMVLFRLLGMPAIRALLGEQRSLPRLVSARVTQNIASQSGREDYVPAKLHMTANGYEAEPVFGKSNLIFTLVRADGLIRIPLNLGGVKQGEMVEVLLD